MIEKVIDDMIIYNAPDMRRINHALKVYGIAKAIGGCEGLNSNEMLTLELSAILHDIGIHRSEEKYGSTAGKHQEIEGPPIAREMLQKYYDDTALINRVCYLIAHHHTYDAVDGTDCQILIEADFIVNLDEEASSRSTILSVKNKIFRTKTGNLLLDKLLLNKSPSSSA